MQRRGNLPTIRVPGRQIALAILVFLTVFSDAAAQTPRATPDGTAPAASPMPANALSIRWDTCQASEFAGARCGTLQVPVDWSQPDGAATELALVVRPADDQEERIGVLLLNNASGGSAIEQLRLALTTGAI